MMIPSSIHNSLPTSQEDCNRILPSILPRSSKQGAKSKELSERKVHVTSPLLPLSQVTYQEDGRAYQLVLDNDGKGYCQVQEGDKIDYVPFSKLASITSGFDPVEFQQRLVEIATRHDSQLINPEGIELDFPKYYFVFRKHQKKQLQFLFFQNWKQKEKEENSVQMFLQHSVRLLDGK